MRAEQFHLANLTGGGIIVCGQTGACTASNKSWYRMEWRYI